MLAPSNNVQVCLQMHVSYLNRKSFQHVYWGIPKSFLHQTIKTCQGDELRNFRVVRVFVRVTANIHSKKQK